MIEIKPKAAEKPMIISSKEKVAIGHQAHLSGTGVHLDRREKRQRTRSAKLKAALND